MTNRDLDYYIKRGRQEFNKLMKKFGPYATDLNIFGVSILPIIYLMAAYQVIIFVTLQNVIIMSIGASRFNLLVKVFLVITLTLLYARFKYGKGFHKHPSVARRMGL